MEQMIKSVSVCRSYKIEVVPFSGHPSPNKKEVSPFSTMTSATVKIF